MRLSPVHHKKLFQMIKAKDVEGAQELLREHIQGAKEINLLSINRNGQTL
jgi:DNA-binding GntR family transcriptional regulator